MEIDIIIDKLTDCLVERATGRIVDTYYMKKDIEIISQEFKGWKFNRRKTQENGYDIYELFTKNDNRLQGRISLKIDGGVADIDIVETAPHNYGHNGKYIGVGAHLFAIACQISVEAGCDGVAAFTAKSDLVEHYREQLNAVEIRPRRMVIFENEAQILINKYIRR